MTILLSTLAIVALAMLALGLGLALGRRGLRGSCGGTCSCLEAGGAETCPRKGDASGRP